MASNAFFPATINQNLFGLSTSATVAINEQSRSMEAAGKTVYRLGFGQSPFPVPETVVQALKDHAHEKDYLPVRGLPELRQAIAGFVNRRKGTHADASDVIIGPGSKELMFLLQLSYYGELIIPAPCWVSYAPQAQIIGRRITRVATKIENNLLLMPEELEAICQQDPERSRLVILNYPSNPTGTAYDTKTLQGLAEVARKYKVLVLSDEIYGELLYHGHADSIAAYYPEGTIISGGLSKWCGAGGWRLGFFVFPKGLKRLEDAMAVCASETFTSTSAPIQYAAVTAFQPSEAIDAYLDLARNILAVIGPYVYHLLESNNISMPKPEGGFYLFPDFSYYRETLLKKGIRTDEELFARLLNETGVALLPGSAFGVPASQFTARLSYVDCDGAALMAAAKTQILDNQFVEQHCAKMITGLNSMCTWLKA